MQRYLGPATDPHVHRQRQVSARFRAARRAGSNCIRLYRR
jgi:hypothetical protein